ncbi:unnamed protein product [Tetraodon nigroviridis]|uniref:(spotted green pufferfish) hypothetical protein n=1 Tax=Tetraodon nigroviridis TaxID=99883 RepID=Q4S470_TETNG|nr:unnamed protein product [Tetraodon nigroviridis]
MQPDGRLCGSAALCWGITSAVPGGPGRAAGCRGRPADQRCGDDASNEADTAQPPSTWAPKGLLLCVEHHRPPTHMHTSDTHMHTSDTHTHTSDAHTHTSDAAPRCSA